ncbi:MAG TPA: hypothetical protein VGX24_04210 [Pyrinomonadaceae bacterium]|jgi:hypothetical protein|nr:hypothetical protein [Pyrinomonadaceae bacterium]
MRHLPTPKAVREKLFDSKRAASPLSKRLRAPKRLRARAVILTVALLSALVCGLQASAQTPTPAATTTPTPTTTPTATPGVTPTANPSSGTTPVTPPNTTSTPVTTPTTTPSPAQPGVSRVMRAYRLGQETQPAGIQNVEEWKRDSMTAGLNQIVILEVAGLKSLLNRAKCLDKDGNKTIATCREKNILLFIEGRPLKGMKPESGAPELKDGENGTLRYHLQRPPEAETANYADSKEHWADLLGLNSIGELFVPTRDVSMSVGLEDEYPIETDVRDANRFHLLRVDQWRLLFWAVLLLLCVLIFIWLARESDIIRDRKPVLWKQRKPYSLSQSQAAWWFFFVVIGFIFIWLVTGQRDLSSSVLVLLGIGFATALGSTVIDRSRTNTPRTEETALSSDLTILLQQKDELEHELTDLETKLKQASPANKPQAQTAFDLMQQQYMDKIKEIRTKFPDALGWNHVKFRIDILSDANGVNFHRFQMVVWTVVLGIIFIHEVLSRLAMPEFSTTLLTLMGISNGTYLIGKSSEPQGTSGAQPGGGVVGAGGASGGAIGGSAGGGLSGTSGALGSAGGGGLSGTAGSLGGGTSSGVAGGTGSGTPAKTGA